MLGSLVGGSPIATVSLAICSPILLKRIEMPVLRGTLVLAFVVSAQARCACDDLVGEWVSHEYNATKQFGSGEVILLEGLSATFTVRESGAYEGHCVIAGTNAWTNGELGGSEPVAGVLHCADSGVDSGDLRIVEVASTAPEGGTHANFDGLVDFAGGVMTWWYAGASGFGYDSEVITFAASFARSDSGILPTVADSTCGVITLATWNSGLYDILEVSHSDPFADGGMTQWDGRTMTLTVNRQDGCRFSGYVTWSTGSEGFSEAYFAGVLHGPSNDFTLLEHAEHRGTTFDADVGMHCRATGTLSADGVLEYIWAGQKSAGAGDLDFDIVKSMVYNTHLGIGEVPPEADACSTAGPGSSDYFVGAWSTESDYEAIRVDLDDNHTYIQDLSARIEITEQHGCTFLGRNTWSSSTAGIGGSEAIIGVLHGDGRATVIEIGDEPDGGSGGLIRAHFEAVSTEVGAPGLAPDCTRWAMHWSYCGAGGGGNYSICFASKHFLESNLCSESDGARAAARVGFAAAAAAAALASLW